MADPNQTLWLALAARNAGTRPSEMAGIIDGLAALDFDLACTYRLTMYDTQCRADQAVLIANEVGRLFAGDAATNDGDRRPALTRMPKSEDDYL